MRDERPESLLKSALEKIVYFEARSGQLSNDLELARVEADRLRGELAQAAQREIELRRVVAELEVRATRAHAEREEMARLTTALRRERAELVGKILDASRIQASDQGPQDFDLAQFIAALRSEVLLSREGPVLVGAPPVVQSDEPPTSVAEAAGELSAQGRLAVTADDLQALAGHQAFPGRSEETLFGFSVRELSAPDAAARVRAAERLLALGHPAAAPALATALHAEVEPKVQVALLAAFAAYARVEGAAVVQPLLSSRSPEVRIAALKALLTIDASRAGPHLSAAVSDPDKAVRRRASLLALGLEGPQALDLGARGIRDADADVRALAALVLGASGAETARPLLLEAMRDGDLRVRRSAGQALSRLLGRDVTALAGLDDAHRRREVRRLARAPVAPVVASAPVAPVVPVPRAVERPVAAVVRAPAKSPVAAPVVSPVVSSPATPAVARRRQAVAVVEAVADAPASPALGEAIVQELRAAIRGRALVDLASSLGVAGDEAMRACTALLQQGRVVRRGLKYFVA